MKVSRIDRARGIKIVRAKYSTATTIKTISKVWLLALPFVRFPLATRKDLSTALIRKGFGLPALDNPASPYCSVQHHDSSVSQTPHSRPIGPSFPGFVAGTRRIRRAPGTPSELTKIMFQGNEDRRCGRKAACLLRPS